MRNGLKYLVRDIGREEGGIDRKKIFNRRLRELCLRM
jgi:hypothetical protein